MTDETKPTNPSLDAQTPPSDSSAIRPRRRLVVQGSSDANALKPSLKQGTIIPNIDGLMQDAMIIVGQELSNYKRKVTNGISLDLKEARVVQGYMETLTKLSKEQRDAARSEDLSNLSNEELLQLATEIAKRPKLSTPDNDE